MQHRYAKSATIPKTTLVPSLKFSIGTRLADALRSHGFTSSEIEKIFHKNGLTPAFSGDILIAVITGFQQVLTDLPPWFLISLPGL